MLISYLVQELCLYLDEERAGCVSVCTECGGPMPLPPPAPGPPVSAVRDEGDGSSSSTNNDEAEISASNLVDELNAVRAREKLYLKGNKMGLNGKKLISRYIQEMMIVFLFQTRSCPTFAIWRIG